MRRTHFCCAIVLAVIASVLGGCGGSSGSSASGGTTGGSGSGSSTTNLSVKVSGLNSGETVTLQAKSDNSSSLTADANGTFYFPQNINNAGTNGATNGISVTVSTEPIGEQCLVEAPSTGITLDSTVPVVCSTPVTISKYATLEAFPGSSAQVIANPKVLPVFFTGAANENTDLVFLQQLVVSQYWGALSEYGVNNGTVESALYETPPSGLSSGKLDDAQIKSALQVSASTWGATFDTSTIIVAFLPSGTSYMPDVSQGEPENAAADHGQITVNGTAVQFVAITGGSDYEWVIAEFLIDAATNPGGGGTDMSASRGYVEMSPDPERYGLTAYLDGHSSAIGHPYQEYVELGSSCFAVAPAESDLTLANGQYLEQIWSNKAAAQANASGNQGYCQPSYGELVNYSSSSDASTVTASRFGRTFKDNALVVPAGSSTTVTVTAWGVASDGNGGQAPWSLTVNPEVFYVSGTAAPSDCSSGTPDYRSYAVASACSNAPSVSVNPNGSSTVSNGDMFKVTITMPSTAEPGLWSILLSGNDGGTEQPILVTNATTWQ